MSSLRLYPRATDSAVPPASSDSIINSYQPDGSVDDDGNLTSAGMVGKLSLAHVPSSGWLISLRTMFRRIYRPSDPGVDLRGH